MTYTEIRAMWKDIEPEIIQGIKDGLYSESYSDRRIRKTNRKRNSRIKIPDVSDSQNFNQNGIIKPWAARRGII